jgi:hypothetical protein
MPPCDCIYNRLGFLEIECFACAQEAPKPPALVTPREGITGPKRPLEAPQEAPETPVSEGGSIGAPIGGKTGPGSPLAPTVRVLRIDSEGGEVFERYSLLRDCFPDDEHDSDYHAARYELERAGRVWIGGGAAPLFLLMRVQS